MRLFIAIDLPDKAKQTIDKIKLELKGLKGIKPVATENIHLTLKFLGEVSDYRAQGIVEALGQVKFKPFKIAISKMGVFPNEQKAQVLWIDAEPAEPLMEIKRQIDAALPRFKDDHPFKNHITFVRIKYVSTDADKKKILDILKKPVEKTEFMVSKFRLYKSDLQPSGPVYDVVEEYFSS
jgi:RNA 2',3'-cyclic 3'-phosphodiesterase